MDDVCAICHGDRSLYDVDGVSHYRRQDGSVCSFNGCKPCPTCRSDLTEITDAEYMAEVEARRKRLRWKFKMELVEECDD